MVDPAGISSLLLVGARVRTILVYDPHSRVIARYLSIIVDVNLTFSFVSRLFSQLKLLDLMSRFQSQLKLLDLTSFPRNIY